MEVTIKIQLTINGKFYATGPRYQKTTSNFLRITLKGSMRVSNEWLLEGDMYINLYGKILGASWKVMLFCKFLKTSMVSDKQLTRLLEFIKLYKQNSLENL